MSHDSFSSHSGVLGTVSFSYQSKQGAKDCNLLEWAKPGPHHLIDCLMHQRFVEHEASTSQLKQLHKLQMPCCTLSAPPFLSRNLNLSTISKLYSAVRAQSYHGTVPSGNKLNFWKNIETERLNLPVAISLQLQRYFQNMNPCYLPWQLA